MSSSVSTSLAEPWAIDRKFANSRDDFRAAPPAMFAGIETASSDLGSEAKPLILRKDLCLAVDKQHEVDGRLPHV